MKSQKTPSNGRITHKLDLSRPTQRQNYNITDFFSNYEEISKIPGPKDDTGDEKVQQEKKATFYYIKEFLDLINLKHWIFLMIMATITTFLSIAIDISIKYTIALRIYLCVDLDLGFLPSFAIWI